MQLGALIEGAILLATLFRHTLHPGVNNSEKRVIEGLPKNPQWQESIAAALLEFNPQQLHEKLQRAEEAKTSRFRELPFKSHNRGNFGE